MVVAIVEADARALISVFGAFLAAFGFYYTGVRDVVLTGTMRDPKSDDEEATADNRRKNKGIVKKAFWPGMLVLAGSSAVVVALMAVPLWDAIWSIDRDAYNPSIAAFVALGLFWGILAVFWVGQSVRAVYRLAAWPGTTRSNSRGRG